MNGQQSDSMVTASNNNNKINKINNNNNITVWAGMDSNPTGRGVGSQDFFSQLSSGELSLNRCPTNTGRPCANHTRQINVIIILIIMTQYVQNTLQLTDLVQTLQGNIIIIMIILIIFSITIWPVD